MSQSNHEDMEDAIRHLEMTLNDLKRECPQSFIGGYEQAVHDIKQHHISYSDDFKCKCNPAAKWVESNEDGEWVCVECGMVVTTDDDLEATLSR